MNPTPRVTVLMPAYNAGEYINKAVDSILNQHFTGFELLIINDGSSDNTLQLLQQYTDPRIRIETQENAGVSAALNKGLSIARGEYICRFDADDISMLNRIDKQVEFLDKNPDYVLVGSDAEYILEDESHLFNFTCIGHTHEEIMNKLYFYCPFIHSSVMYRKEAVIKAGAYSPYAHNFEDYLLWTQLKKFGKFYNIPEQLVKIRFNAASVTMDEKWRGRRFRELKRNIILRGSITKEEGDELLSILKKQGSGKTKLGAYHALCAKKFLADNYKPAIARDHIKKAIAVMPARLDNYLLFIISFLPFKLISWMRNKKPNKL